MRHSWRWLPLALAALVPFAASADSLVQSVSLAASADCTSNASVNWSFTYTANPSREFGRVTALSGTVIGTFDQPSTLSGGSYSGTWNSFISIPQPPNSLIGSYGGAGDEPPSANTAEYFVLYNCSTRQVLYSCKGNRGSCPTTAAQGLALASDAIPTQSPAWLAATLLLLASAGAFALRRQRAR